MHIPIAPNDQSRDGAILSGTFLNFLFGRVAISRSSCFRLFVYFPPQRMGWGGGGEGMGLFNGLLSAASGSYNER